LTTSYCTTCFLYTTLFRSRKCRRARVHNTWCANRIRTAIRRSSHWMFQLSFSVGLLHMKNIELVSIGIGEYKAIESVFGFRFGNKGSPGVSDFVRPTVHLVLGFRRERENHFVCLLWIGQLHINIGLKHVPGEEVDYQLAVPEKKAGQLAVRCPVGLEAKGIVEPGGPFQIGHREVCPDAFWFHDAVVLKNDEFLILQKYFPDVASSVGINDNLKGQLRHGRPRMNAR